MTALVKSQGHSPTVLGDDDDVDVSGQSSSAIQIGQSRAVGEIQAAMTIAKRYPRDENIAYSKVMQACKRPKLAELSQYEFPRGGKTVTGPTIKLVKTIARYWGNIRSGIVEIARRRGYSECQAFAWDLETNTESTLAFTVRHERDTREGKQILSEERDIDDLILNKGARRLRSCLETVIPSDLVDDAIEQCDETLKASSDGVPLGDRIKRMAAAFLDLGVSVEMLRAKVGHDISSASESELAKLRKLYVAIKDGATTAADAFSAQLTTTAKEDAKKSRTEELKEKLRQQAPEAPREPGSDDDIDEPESPSRPPGG